ncbi:MAG: substrate-binding domain-containing protein [bacterium]|nr:substrate-binding domain-containing protein [Candidatus Sumerlaeota bacterium]
MKHTKCIMRAFVTASAVCAAAAIAFHSSRTATAAGDETKGGKFVFGVIAKSQSNPVFQAALKGAQAAAKALSKDGVEITIDWRTPNEEDAQKQADNIEKLVNAGANGVAMSCSDASKVTKAINAAVEKGVPVMCFDSDAPQSKRFAYFGVDDEQTGARVMEELVKALGGQKGRIVVLAGNQTAPNLQARVRGVITKAAAMGFTIDSTKDVFYHKETPQDAAQKVEEVQNNNPEIVGWAMVGGWPLFTDALLKWEPGKVKIVAVDALPAQLPYVEKGVAQMLLAQPVFDWGYKSTEMLLAKAQGKGVSDRNICELIPVTKDNLKDWAKKLKNWGFEVNPKFLE